MVIIKTTFTKSFLVGIASSTILFLVFGMVTSIIQNPFFIRMTPVRWLEWTSLIVTSSLIGIYIGLTYYGRKTATKKCNVTATAGGVFGFLTFGCSICNKILVLLLGVTGVLTYFEPVRPALGVLSIGLLGTAVVYKAKKIREFKNNLNKTFIY